MTERVHAAILAMFLLPFGLITLAFYFAGESTYADLARERGQNEVVFPLEGGGSWHTDRTGVTQIHRQTVAYLFGDRAELPLDPNGRPLFTADERAHMVDVQRLFAMAEVIRLLAGVGLLAFAIGARRLARTSAVRITRGGVLASGAIVLAFGAFGAIAFGPAFLFFHQIFFPQGNFLFDPATSNLLRVYPEPYWVGVTSRIVVSFLGGCAALALISTALMRR